MTKLIDRARLRATTQVERETKADDVERLARALLETWTRECSGAKGITFYMHTTYQHLPDMIRRLPCDILLASGDAFEAKNQQLKKILRRRVCFWIIKLIDVGTGGQTSDQRPKEGGSAALIHRRDPIKLLSES